MFTYKGHTEAVKDIKFSPDGQWVVSASSDATVKVSVVCVCVYMFQTRTIKALRHSHVYSCYTSKIFFPIQYSIILINKYCVRISDLLKMLLANKWLILPRI